MLTPGDYFLLVEKIYMPPPASQKDLATGLEWAGRIVCMVGSNDPEKLTTIARFRARILIKMLSSIPKD